MMMMMMMMMIIIIIRVLLASNCGAITQGLTVLKTGADREAVLCIAMRACD